MSPNRQLERTVLGRRVRAVGALDRAVRGRSIAVLGVTVEGETKW